MLNPLLKIMVAVLASSFMSCSFAADWRLIFKTNNSELFIDQSTMPSIGAEKSITIKSNQIQGEKSPSSLELKYLVNCSSNEVSLVSARQFKGLDLQGDGINLAVSSPSKPMDGKPGTAAAAYVKAACEKPVQQSGSSPQGLPKNAQASQQQAKLRDLLKNTWGWDDATIQNSITQETQNIKKQNPGFNEDQVRDAVYSLWAKRAKDITNPEIGKVNVPNPAKLANVNPWDPDFVYPIPNISACFDKHCLNAADYKKTCQLVKNMSYQAATMSTSGGLDARLLERQGVISDVAIKWENNQCLLKYVVTGVFDGKKEGCRVYGVATAFAVGEPGGIVVNRAYPLPAHKDSTCRLY